MNARVLPSDPTNTYAADPHGFYDARDLTGRVAAFIVARERVAERAIMDRFAEPGETPGHALIECAMGPLFRAGLIRRDPIDWRFIEVAV
jgi:hypothetical protein